jgi:5-formyltetrahydrofolate cyclo-ligase
MQHGKRVDWQEMQPYDLVVVGCVAVTRQGGRTGKGAGFADLELGIMRIVGLVTPATPVVTTVHSLQVVDDERVIMVAHDTPLDWVITPDEAIETHTRYSDPQGIDWESVQPDQYDNIPFLRALRQRLSSA